MNSLFCPKVKSINFSKKNEMQQKNPLRIIIADDDFDEIDLLKDAFEKHPNFEIIACVNNGQGIIDAVAKSKSVPDDLSMIKLQT